MGKIRCIQIDSAGSTHSLSRLRSGLRSIDFSLSRVAKVRFRHLALGKLGHDLQLPPDSLNVGTKTGDVHVSAREAFRDRAYAMET